MVRYSRVKRSHNDPEIHSVSNTRVKVMPFAMILTQAAERKTLLISRHTLNAFSERRLGRTLEASKGLLPDFPVVVYEN